MATASVTHLPKTGKQRTEDSAPEDPPLTPASDFDEVMALSTAVLMILDDADKDSTFGIEVVMKELQKRSESILALLARGARPQDDPLYESCEMRGLARLARDGLTPAVECQKQKMALPLLVLLARTCESIAEQLGEGVVPGQCAEVPHG